jgi:hypothetical protein
MNHHRSLVELILGSGIALVLISSGEVRGQSLETMEPYPNDLPATGNINDLDGLQERQVSDWFPQESIGTDSPTLLEINSDNSSSPIIKDRTTQIREQDNWQRNSSGEPKQTGSGIPLGTF